jgi:hypothetical protein
VAALEAFIHLAMAPDRKLEELPTAIGILRNLQFPVALIAIGRREVDGVWREGRLLFGAADAVDGASGAGFAGSQRMQVWAYLPAIVIPLLGDLLADRLDVSAIRRTATPAEELQAGESAGRVSQKGGESRGEERRFILLGSGPLFLAWLVFVAVMVGIAAASATDRAPACGGTASVKSLCSLAGHAALAAG